MLGRAAAIIAVVYAATYAYEQAHKKSISEQRLPTPIPNVRIEPTLTPTPPPSTGKITIAFPDFPKTPAPTIAPRPELAEPVAPSSEEETFLPAVDALIRLLTSTKQIAIEEKSFKDFIEGKGYTMNVYELSHPQTGKVKPTESLRTRVLPTVLPTTDKNIKILGNEYWLPGNTEVLITHVVILTKKDGSRTEVWMARFDEQANRIVFNVIEIRYKEGGEEKRETFIEVKNLS